MVLPVSTASAALARCGTGAAAPSTTAALAADAVRQVEHYRDVGDRPVERFHFAVLDVHRADRLQLWRQQHGGDDLARLEIVLALNVDLRQQKEVFQLHLALGARLVGELEPGAERGERRRRGGGMNDGAAVVVEDRVILVLAGEGEAGIAALARAMMGARAEIPAARPLQQVAADGGDVADLRAGGGAGRLGQGAIARADLVIGARAARASRSAPMRKPPLSGTIWSRPGTSRRFTTRRGVNRPSFIRSSRSMPPAFTTAASAASLPLWLTIAAATVAVAAPAACAISRGLVHSKLFICV